MLSFVLDTGIVSAFKRLNLRLWVDERDLEERLGQVFGFAEDVRFSRFSTILRTNEIMTIGRYSYTWSGFPTGTAIGNYCSIAKDVETMGMRHPYERFTTSPITYDRKTVQFGDVAPWNRLKAVKNPRKTLPPAIGHDVWIGQGVTIAPDVRIGNGAVVGACAVVTKDVPPYHIVAGSPARTLKTRFSEKQIERLHSSNWFEFDIPFLAFADHENIDAFVDAVENAKALGKLPAIERPPLLSDLLAGIDEE